MINNAMLITSCPACRTTFRISTEILEQANGQVRCGQCHKIFNGNTSLREVAEPEAASDPEKTRQARASPESDSQPPAAKKIEAGDKLPVPASREPDWLNEPEPANRKIWPWATGAALMALALAGQFVHQYRSELAALPAIGPAIAGAYAQVGVEVAPPVDLDQYDLLDLTAQAQPLGEEPGWLIIETRVTNKGPDMQPVPTIFVSLLDRWDATVAGRYFAPEEYAVTTVSDYSRMSAGAVIDAQFIIMDPGPSATGFELEICVPAKQGYFCESDIRDD